MLCFQGRCYPAGEAASSTEIRRGKQSFLNEDQKADLKKKMAERYTKQFPGAKPSSMALMGYSAAAVTVEASMSSLKVNVYVTAVFAETVPLG